MLTLIEGPAGGGKSDLAREMRTAGEIDLIADVTALWVALTGVRRGPDGRYPVRLDDDPALGAARYLQTTAVHHGLRENLNVAVTASVRDQAGKWGAVAAENGAGFRVQTVDPGIDVVTDRLADPISGELSEECDVAIGRWYR